MAAFTCKDFTEKVLNTYARQLMQRVKRARFKLETDAAVAAAKELRSLRYLADFEPMGIDILLDQHFRNDQSLKNENEVAENVAGGLAEPLITAIENELQPEEDDPIKRIGTGELWVVHRAAPAIATMGGAQLLTATLDGLAVIGEASFQGVAVGNKYRARTDWALARVGEVKNQPLIL